MVRFYLIFCFSLLPFWSFSSKFPALVDSLIIAKQYASAWSILQETLSDSSPETVISKSKFCLQYFSHTSFHQKFYFSNLKNEENLLKVRQQAPSNHHIFANFNVEKELLVAKRAHENNHNIDYALGTYYHDVFLTYHNNWKKGEKETMALFFFHFMEAYKSNIKSALSTYAISYYYQKRKTFRKATSFLLQSIAIDSMYAPSHYNLAYLHSLKDSISTAIDHAKKAYINYNIRPLKADAAAMVGILNGDLKEHVRAIKWLLISDALKPGNVVVYENLLKSYLALNKKEEALLITKNLYEYDYKSGRIINTIIQNYIDNKQSEELLLFFNERVKAEPNNMELQGFSHLHLCQLHMNLKQIKTAKKELDCATNCFNICYDKDHSIYRIIEKLNYDLNK